MLRCASLDGPMHLPYPRFVIKLGTGLLTTPRGNTLDVRQFRRLTAEIAALIGDGRECVVVTSGAVAAGMMALKLGNAPATCRPCRRARPSASRASCGSTRRTSPGTASLSPRCF